MPALARSMSDCARPWCPSPIRPKCQIRSLMRETPLVDDVGLGIIAHARSTRGVGREPSAESRASGYFDRARRAEPLLGLLRRIIRRARFVFTRTSGDADHWIAQRILHLWIQIQVLVFVR